MRTDGEKNRASYQGPEAKGSPAAKTFVGLVRPEGRVLVGLTIFVYVAGSAGAMGAYPTSFIAIPGSLAFVTLVRIRLGSPRASILKPMLWLLPLVGAAAAGPFAVQSLDTTSITAAHAILGFGSMPVALRMGALFAGTIAIAGWRASMPALWTRGDGLLQSVLDATLVVFASLVLCAMLIAPLVSVAAAVGVASAVYLLSRLVK